MELERDCRIAWKAGSLSADARIGGGKSESERGRRIAWGVGSSGASIRTKKGISKQEERVGGSEPRGVGGLYKGPGRRLRPCEH